MSTATTPDLSALSSKQLLARLRGIRKDMDTLRDRQERRLEIYCRARLSGLAWSDIGDAAGISEEAVHRAVRRAAEAGYELAIEVREYRDRITPMGAAGG